MPRTDYCTGALSNSYYLTSWSRSCDRRSVQACLGVGLQIFLSGSCGILDVGHPLWREDGSVIYSYSCFWALLEQSFSGPSPAELTAIFYCLIWDSTNLEGQVPVFISPRNRLPHLYPSGTGFPFRCLLRLAGLRWGYSNPPPHGLLDFKAKVALRLMVSQYILMSSPFWFSWPDVCYCLTVIVVPLWGASPTRDRVCRFQVNICSV
jgi:hypothetical protein